MAEPTLKTTSTPLDQLLQAAWQARIGTWVGVTWANMSTVQQTEGNRLINGAHEFISQRLGHRPWLRREATLSLVTDQGRYAMPADFRHLLDPGILEGTGNSRVRVKINTQEEWRKAFPLATGSSTSAATHEWDNQDDPHWVYRGMDASDPPVVVYERIPAPSSAKAGTDNVTLDYRPYQELMDATNYAELPASMVEATIEHIRMKWATFEGSFNKAAFHRQLREDELAATNINDNKENEHPIRQELPDDFLIEMGLYDTQNTRIYGR